MYINPQDRILRAARNLARMAENARKAQEAAALRLQAKWHLLGADREAIELLQRVTDHRPTPGIVALREEIDGQA